MEFQTLHKEIYMCCRKEIDWKRETLVDDAKKIFPLIQEFTQIVANPENFDMQPEEYQEFYQYYLQILTDIVHAVEVRDTVLLFDSLAYGLLEFVIIFLPEGEWEKL